MAAVALSNFVIRNRQEGEAMTAFLVSPSTMDSADTVDITDILQGRTVVNISAWDTTDGDSVTATYNNTTDVITVDAAGGSTDQVYCIKVDLLRID